MHSNGCYKVGVHAFRMQAISRTPFSDENQIYAARFFAYCRVSTADQTTQNQSMEIKAPRRFINSR